MAGVAAGSKARASQVGLAGSESVRTSASGTFTTTETQLDTITVPVVSGRRYKIVWNGQVQSSVADGYVRCRIRETSVTGTVLQIRNVGTTMAAGQSVPLHAEAFWTASSTGDAVFLFTAVRQAGTGNISSFAAGDSPVSFYVQNISGS
ncbi:hypothetical protein [Actinokineospora sp. UTMC 2448]|uniref:hypothetical protein n=1 Tax=Actinokineospora sp. UTMC 2448 TaxID=2268449 RepID=UPI0021640CF9|nr:hypothetical protein [Actinokineospora sp. UTMC 2448]UVS81852.1 hypothetical protein Actkin_05616 [Actinokineospora sp. UTMC 2448]